MTKEKIAYKIRETQVIKLEFSKYEKVNNIPHKLLDIFS
jgi:hypothetical protein